MTLSERCRLIHISDTHLTANRDELVVGANPSRRTDVLVTALNQLIEDGLPVDAVIHTGDIVNDGDTPAGGADSTAAAAALLGKLQVPCIVLNGNHDDKAALSQNFDFPRSAVPLPGVIVATLDARPELSPSADGRVAGVDDPAGILPVEQLHQLEQTLTQAELPVAVFMHYPPLALDCDWIDQQMLVTNGAQLHKLLLAHRDKVAGVFFGHIHRSVQRLQDGILYCAVGSSAFHSDGWPQSETARFSTEPVAWYNYISIGAGSTIVKQQVLVHDC